MTTLDVSPCRECPKQMKVYCRNKCKRLKDYQRMASITINVREYAEQYSGEMYGIRKQIPRKAAQLAAKLLDPPLSELAEEEQHTSYGPNRPYPPKMRPHQRCL